MEKLVEAWLLRDVYPVIGMDKPSNHDELVEFIVEDVKETADPEEYHSGDFAIAFRRFIESKED